MESDCDVGEYPIPVLGMSGDVTVGARARRTCRRDRGPWLRLWLWEERAAHPGAIIPTMLRPSARPRAPMGMDVALPPP